MHRELDLIVYGSTREIVLGGFDESKLKWIKIKPNTMMRINTRSLKWVSKSITFRGHTNTPFRFDNYDYDESIGAYRYLNKRAKTNETVLGFVPVYSYADSIKMNKKKKHNPIQMNAFKKTVCDDGSTIKKINGGK